MKSFNNFLKKLTLTNEMILMIRKIGECKGKQDLYKKQAPDVLENLRHFAIIQSTESSNRLEHITLDEKRFNEIMKNKSQPQNRNEAKIAGYRDVLSLIHSSAKDIPFTVTVVQQLHRDILKYTGIPGGKWKVTDNEISEILPDGKKIIRFKTVKTHLVSNFMTNLHERFNQELQDNKIEPLILIPSYILDFLCVHPFLDGNGRISRLISLLLLYQQGYEVGRYISLERIIENTRESYYDTLKTSSQNWHEGNHNIIPWITYFLSTMLAAYDEFERRSNVVVSGRGSKTEMIVKTIENFIGNFTIGDIEKACPLVSRDMIRHILKQLHAKNKIEAISKGRYAKWRKIQ
jgi:Fic family protein